MNEELQKQLVRQLKILNFWITLFGSIIVISLIIMGFLVYKVVSFTNSTRNEISDLKSSLNVTNKVCEGDGSLTGFLQDKTSICE